MTTVHERRKNELQDALNIVEERLTGLAVDLWFMPKETPAQLRRLAEKINSINILLGRKEKLTEKLNAMADSE